MCVRAYPERPNAASSAAAWAMATRSVSSKDSSVKGIAGSP
jgi:hypothetical protein